MRRILPSITTHGAGSGAWMAKIAEVSELQLNEVALFLTGVPSRDRPEFFKQLEVARRIRPFTIPFVHAVSSMSDEEFRYLRGEFGTQAFNLHPVIEYPLSHPLSAEVRSRIFIENTRIEFPLEAQDIDGFAGLCLDLSHLEDARISAPAHYEQVLSLVGKFPVGANHLSGVGDTPREQEGEYFLYSTHCLQSSREMRYLWNLPPVCFSNLCAIELENPLSQQVALIEQLSEALNRTGSSDRPDAPSTHP